MLARRFCKVASRKGDVATDGNEGVQSRSSVNPPRVTVGRRRGEIAMQTSRHICYATGDRKWSSGESRFKQGETDMGDKGKKDKGKREQQKKAQLNLKEKRKQKQEKKK